MKKLIMMSFLALGVFTANAGNGQTEIAVEDFKQINVDIKNSDESKEFFHHTANYHIIARVFICGPGYIGTDYFETATGANGTGCVDSTQLASLIALYENMYGITKPDACNVVISAELIDTCIHP